MQTYHAHKDALDLLLMHTRYVGSTERGLGLVVGYKAGHFVWNTVEMFGVFHSVNLRRTRYLGPDFRV